MITATLVELQSYVPVANAFNLTNFLSKIRKAERDLAEKWLGKDFYETLITGEDEDMKDMLKNAIYNYAFFLYLPFAGVRVSNTGAQQTKTSTEGPARPEDVENLRIACYNTAMEELENVFAILEQTKPEAWTNSQKYSVFNELFIKTVEQFQKHCEIGNSRRLFITLRTSIRYVEDFIIKSAISEPLFTALKAATPPTNKKAELLNKYLIPAIAHFAMADGLPGLMVILGKYDTVLQFDNTGANGQKSYKSAPKVSTDALIAAEQAKAERILNDGLDFIRENLSDFPEYPSFTGNPNKMDTVKSTTAVWF